MSHNWLAGIALFPPTEHYMKKELTKFFEYMNAGLPIICSHFPQWKTFIDKYNCGIAVDPYDEDRKSTRLNSSHVAISYAVFCLKKKNRSKTRLRDDTINENQE